MDDLLAKGWRGFHDAIVLRQAQVRAQVRYEVRQVRFEHPPIKADDPLELVRSDRLRLEWLAQVLSVNEDHGQCTAVKASPAHRIAQDVPYPQACHRALNGGLILRRHFGSEVRTRAR